MINIKVVFYLYPVLRCIFPKGLCQLVKIYFSSRGTSQELPQTTMVNMYTLNLVKDNYKELRCERNTHTKSEQ